MSSKEQSDKPFRMAEVKLNPRPPCVYESGAVNKLASNSAQVLLSNQERVQIPKGRKSPTIGHKPTEREAILSQKGNSPGVTSGKTQASTAYTRATSDLSGNANFLFGKVSSQQSIVSHQRSSSIGKPTTLSLAKAKSNGGIDERRGKATKLRSSNNLNCYSQ